MGQVRIAKNGIQRCTHVVGHVAEKDRLRPGALLGSIQRLLQKERMLQLLAFFRVHIAEAPNNLFRGALRIIDRADVYPLIDAVEAAPEIAAIVVNIFRNALADAFLGKTLLKGLKGAFIHKFLNHLEQCFIVAAGADAAGHVGRRFNGFIALGMEIDAVNGIIGVAENLNGAVCLLKPLMVVQIPQKHVGQR